MLLRFVGTAGLVVAVVACGDSTDTAPPGGGGGTTASGTGGTGLTATGTGSGTGGTTSGTGGAGGGLGGMGGAGAADCTPVTLGELQLTDTEPGGSSLAFAIEGLASGEEHILFLEFYDDQGAQTAGSYDLSQPPDDNYSTCVHCVLVYENFSLASPTAYYPTSGTMNVTTPDASFTGESAGTLTSLRLVEVTVDQTVTTPVSGGACLTIANSPWDTAP